jgi:ferrous iron transport protein A
MELNMEITVNDLKNGERAVVTGLGCSGALRRRIIDMGITPGAVVIMRKAAPMGDPLEINVRGYELSIRRAEAKQITVMSES